MLGQNKMIDVQTNLFKHSVQLVITENYMSNLNILQIALTSGISFCSCEIHLPPCNKQQLPVRNSWTSLTADSDSKRSGHSVTPVFKPSANV